MSTTKLSTGHVALVERKRGPQFYARIRVGGSGGRMVVKKLGPAWVDRRRKAPPGYLTRKDADARLREMLTDADRGSLAVAAKQSGVTFAEAAAEWLRYLRDDREREPSTLGDYLGVLEGYLLPRFGERDITEITSAHVAAYRDELKGLRRKDGTRRLGNRVIVRHLAVLHGVFRRAMAVWDLPRNPAAAELVHRPPVLYDTNRFNVLQPDEVRLAAGRMEISVERALIVTAAFSGLRLGELFALRWADVDFSLRRLHVRRSLARAARKADGSMVRREKTPKSGKVRSSVLVDDVIVALDELSRREHFTAPGDLVFCNDVGEHLSDGMLRRRWYEALKQAGLPQRRLHDLRHTFGTLAAQAYEIPKVQGYLGHAHISTTVRCMHHVPADGDAARLQAVLDRVPNELPNSAPERVTRRNAGTAAAS